MKAFVAVALLSAVSLAHAAPSPALKTEVRPGGPLGAVRGSLGSLRPGGAGAGLLGAGPSASGVSGFGGPSVSGVAGFGGLPSGVSAGRVAGGPPGVFGGPSALPSANAAGAGAAGAGLSSGRGGASAVLPSGAVRSAWFPAGGQVHYGHGGFSGPYGNGLDGYGFGFAGVPLLGGYGYGPYGGDNGFWGGYGYGYPAYGGSWGSQGFGGFWPSAGAGGAASSSSVAGSGVSGGAPGGLGGVAGAEGLGSAGATAGVARPLTKLS